MQMRHIYMLALLPSHFIFFPLIKKDISYVTSPLCSHQHTHTHTHIREYEGGVHECIDTRVRHALNPTSLTTDNNSVWECPLKTQWAGHNSPTTFFCSDNILSFYKSSTKMHTSSEEQKHIQYFIKLHIFKEQSLIFASLPVISSENLPLLAPKTPHCLWCSCRDSAFEQTDVLL